MPRKNFIIAIHGGAGPIRPSRYRKTIGLYYQALEETLAAGFAILKKGGSSLDAVVECAGLLEDNPLFNAGRGSVLNDQGFAQLDAAVMEGKALRVGGVAGLERVRNPVEAAREVLLRSPHSLFAGYGGDAFARRRGLKMVPNRYFLTDKDRQKRRQHLGDTVGAVALDRRGNLAAATSTGGLRNKAVGRVSDSCIAGAGNYAENGVCAVSCTGKGDHIIRLMTAHDVAAQMKYGGESLENAARQALKKLAAIGGEGGLVAIGADGAITMPFNAEGMFRGFLTSDGRREVGAFRKPFIRA